MADLLERFRAKCAELGRTFADHAALAALPDAEHRSRWRRDLGELRVWSRGLDRVIRRTEACRRLFRSPKPLGFDERRRLRGLWAGLLDFLAAIDGLKLVHSGFPLLLLRNRRAAHARSLLAAYVSCLSQYHAGLRFLRLTMGRRPIETLLDEEAPELGLAAGQYRRLKWNLLHVADVAKVLLGGAYLERMLPDLPRERSAAWAAGEARRLLPRVKALLRSRGVPWFAGNALAILRRGVFAAWFPVQKNAALCLRARIKDRPPLVAPAQAAGLAARLRPGDILLERRNWHLSNIGLPGFWPHAALYVGTPEEIARAFGPDFLRRLRRRFPARLREYAAKPNRVIEALAEGVIFTTLEQSAGADYVCALRPRRGARAAVERAFHYHGRPYDFDFDFLSDSALVCSELVWKGYQEALDLPLVPIAGRLVLPPTEIVRKFDRELGTPRQELDFVCFLDGLEAEGRAVERGAEELRRSHLRPKWDFLQK